MIFLEVDDVDRYWNELLALNLTEKYKKVKLIPVRTEAWAKNVSFMILQAYYGTLASFLTKP